MNRVVLAIGLQAPAIRRGRQALLRFGVLIVAELPAGRIQAIGMVLDHRARRERGRLMLKRLTIRVCAPSCQSYRP